MKTKEELNALKDEVEALNKKLAELTDEKLAEIMGGWSCVGGILGISDSSNITIPGFKPGKTDVHIYKVEKDSDI